ncbi:WYL domain-containing protein [Ramlibacter sp. AW1]|uniref:WYL domain-containing protein n=1 Tax=Ramlibacter aurantiacus TaxID=2801330 RepID=A0A937D8B1_9BURK|nr:WYL domain-containing protein [Ramlibacter aurantiacus]MBL0421881.1 WYL domain-containing protein [Ramlibacter aurantiacus]
MSELVRLYRYKELLGGRRAVPAGELQSALEISRATFKRDIAKLRDQLKMPIRFDKERGGYVMDIAHADSSELPGLWFSPQEILALVTIQQLLAQLEPGILGPKLRPLQERLSDLMSRHGLTAGDVARRIRLVHAGKRQLHPAHFESVAAGTLGRKRLRVRHFNRQTGETLDRVISPQRLVHYRDNWYVDAWCHLREGLRSFSVDALTQVDVMEEGALEIEPGRLDEHLGGGYGIFGGAATAVARLRFTPERARWVRREQWHPNQQAWDEADGSYVLEVPYADDREILGDILRFGDDVEVVEPQGLRVKVRQALVEAAGRYV